MAVSIDPIISNVFFTLGLLPHTSKRNKGYYNPKLDCMDYKKPLVSILIPLYLEPYKVIKNLSDCLINQTYDHQNIEIIFITELDDKETNIYVKNIVDNIKDKFFAVKHLIADGKKKMKPYALNYGLDQCTGKIIGIYDAECEPEDKQIEKAIGAIFEQNYDLIQTKIEIESNNLLGELYKLDIYMWYEIYLPFIKERAGAFPLGTKGLFIKKSCLEDIGKFPLHLTEDAMMSILLAHKNKKFGLVESTTKENSPRTWKVHYRQRRRWFRGYLSCMLKLIKVDMPLKKKFWMAIPYTSPILCSLSFLGFSFLFLYFISWGLVPELEFIAPWMNTILYDKYIFYWSLFLGYIGLPFTMLSYLYSIADEYLEKKALYVYMIPIYWIFLGICAISCFFKDGHHWDKTKRET